MTFFSLSKPSISALRTHFIQERLQLYAMQEISPICIASTGKTGSGKSTLGNRLVGVEYFLKSDGHQDCTDRVHVIQFPAGLEYIDLPGVASDEQLENYNRVALGLEQVPDWPQVDMLTMMLYNCDQLCEERKISLAQIPHNQLQPDLIFYLVAPHQQLLRSDITYMVDLLRRYGSKRIVYVFNLFADKETGLVSFATPQNVADAKYKITQAYQEVGLNPVISNIVEVNCWTGQGLAELITSARTALDEIKGKLFEEIIQYQQERVPEAYLTEIKGELVRFFAKVAFEKSSSGTYSQNPLFERIETLRSFLSDVLGKEMVLSEIHRNSFNELVNQISEHLKREVTEPIIERRSRDIYEEIPRYKEVEEIDYNAPKYKSEEYWDRPQSFIEHLDAIENALDGKGYRVKRWRQVPDGYETKKVWKKEKKKKIGTEYWDVEVGRKVIDIVYEPFGVKGIALLATYTYFLMSDLNDDNNMSFVETVYENMLKPLRESLEDCHKLPDIRVVELLKERLEDLFDSSFDESLVGRELTSALLINRISANNTTSFQPRTGWVVDYQPSQLFQGEKLTLLYNGLLSSASQVYLHWSKNNWAVADVQDGKMKRHPAGFWYSLLRVPKDAIQINFAFNDGDGHWDNNCGGDWNLTIDVLQPHEGWVVDYDPERLYQGERLTILYNGFLSSASQVYLHWGKNGWQHIDMPDRKMKRHPDGFWYTPITIPEDATQIHFAFNDGYGHWDNNGGGNWNLTIGVW